MDKFVAQAEAKLDQARYSQAVFIFKKALKSPFLEDKTRALLGLSHSLRMLGRFQEAGKFYAKAGALAREENDTQALVDTAVGLAMSYRGQEKYYKAYQLLTRSLVHDRSLKDKEGLAHAYWFLGGTLRLLG